MRKDLRVYHSISFPDLKDIVWDAILKHEDDKGFSDTWLKNKFMKKVKIK